MSPYFLLDDFVEAKAHRIHIWVYRCPVFHFASLFVYLFVCMCECMYVFVYLCHLTWILFDASFIIVDVEHCGFPEHHAKFTIAYTIKSEWQRRGRRKVNIRGERENEWMKSVELVPNRGCILVSISLIIFFDRITQYIQAFQVIFSLPFTCWFCCCCCCCCWFVDFLAMCAPTVSFCVVATTKIDYMNYY